VIVVPVGNSVEKNRAMRALGAELVEFGEDFQAASDHAVELERENGWHRVPSFDLKLVAGVATYALEMFSACPELETMYVPIGMGSGVCGTMAVRDALGLKTKVVGVVSSQAPAYALSFAAGRVVEHEARTAIADGVACRRPDGAALERVRAGVDRIVAVEDEEVREAMRVYFADTHNVAEGAGAIGLAALLKDRAAGGARVGTVLCGGNVDSDVFAGVLGRAGRA
jgi:threonine dehydratase